jgi:ABC-type phosphate transport system substrate-binding protein
MASCASPATPVPTPPELPFLATTPGFRPWVEASLTRYVAERGALDFFVTLYPPAEIEAALEKGEVDLAAAGLAPPPGWFAAPLGDEVILVILPLSNSVESLSPSELAGVFSGRVQNWDELDAPPGAIQPYIPLPGDALRERFAASILHDAKFTSNAILAPSPSAMLAAVNADPGGIGLLPASQLDGSVKAVALDGQSPGAGEPSMDAYPLRVPVIALAPTEPIGALREWLGWAQVNPIPWGG